MYRESFNTMRKHGNFLYISYKDWLRRLSKRELVNIRGYLYWITPIKWLHTTLFVLQSDIMQLQLQSKSFKKILCCKCKSKMFIFCIDCHLFELKHSMQIYYTYIPTYLLCTKDLHSIVGYWKCKNSAMRNYSISARRQ